LREQAYAALNDDLNTAIAISHLFEGARIINSVNGGTESLTAEDITHLRETMHLFVFDILGLKSEVKGDSDDLNGVMDLLLLLRADAKAKKDFATSDKIRDELVKLNFIIKDGKDGTSWSKA
jgi:cysteinyl-tRNA synthetase